MFSFFARLLRRLLKLCAALVLLCAVAFATVCLVTGWGAYHEAVSAKPLEVAVGDIQGKADYTPLDQVPQIYREAVVSVEDHRFYDHHGFDVIGTARAIFHNALAGEIREGGSTITQQLARNLYFTQEHSLSRKIGELMVAIQLERHYTKDEILALYMNSIYYGDGYYSIAQASWGYFGVPPSGLSAGQATMLAGVPNAPSVYAPTVNYDLARARQAQVLEAMVDEDVLSHEEAEAIYGGAL